MTTPSFLATVYRLTLGDYDATTGIPALQYSPTVGRVSLGWKGSSVSLGNMLFFPQTDGVMLTMYNYNVGDIVVDPATSAPEVVYGKIMARRPITAGNVFVGYVMDLKQVPFLPFYAAEGNNNGLSVMGGFDPAFFNENYFAHFYITVP